MKLEDLKRLSAVKKVVDADGDIAEMLGNPSSLAELDAALIENKEIADVIEQVMGSASPSKPNKAKEPESNDASVPKGKPGYKVCQAGLHLIGVRSKECKECNATGDNNTPVAEVASATATPDKPIVAQAAYPEPTKAFLDQVARHYAKLAQYHVQVGHVLSRVQLVAELAVILAQIMEDNINK